MMKSHDIAMKSCLAEGWGNVCYLAIHTSLVNIMSPWKKKPSFLIQVAQSHLTSFQTPPWSLYAGWCIGFPNSRIVTIPNIMDSTTQEVMINQQRFQTQPIFINYLASQCGFFYALIIIPVARYFFGIPCGSLTVRHGKIHHFIARYSI